MELGVVQRVQPAQILENWKDAWHNILTALPQEYRLDVRRLSSTTVVMILGGTGLIFLEWYFQDYSDFQFGFFLGIFFLGAALYQLVKLFFGKDVCVLASKNGIQYSSARENWQVNWKEIEKTWERNQ